MHKVEDKKVHGICYGWALRPFADKHQCFELNNKNNAYSEAGYTTLFNINTIPLMENTISLFFLNIHSVLRCPYSSFIVRILWLHYRSVRSFIKKQQQ